MVESNIESSVQTLKINPSEEKFSRLENMKIAEEHRYKGQFASNPHMMLLPEKAQNEVNFKALVKRRDSKEDTKSTLYEQSQPAETRRSSKILVEDESAFEINV